MQANEQSLAGYEAILRLERKSDWKIVEQVTYRAFRGTPPTGSGDDGNEALLARNLRNCAAFVPELDYVAELNGAVIGNIMYTRSKVIGDYYSSIGDSGNGLSGGSGSGGGSGGSGGNGSGGSGNGHSGGGNVSDEWVTLTFGPVSVLPKFQRQGVGGALIRKSLDAARDLGHRAVLIFGHESYYPRFGFKPASEYGITTADGKNFPAFMALPLYNGALEGVRGRLICDEVYTSLDKDESDMLNAKLAEPMDIDEYIDAQPPASMQALRAVRDLIRLALPDAMETISWQMPTYRKSKNIIHFAAQKKHLGIYPGAEALEHFKPRLTEYKTSKGAIQFPYNSLGSDQLNLISEIAAWCGNE